MGSTDDDNHLLRIFFWVFLVQLTLNMLAWGGLIGWTAYQEWKLRETDVELRLLRDYTEGRIDHLPYQPTEGDEP